jgi:hypothetical protein
MSAHFRALYRKSNQRKIVCRLIVSRSYWDWSLDASNLTASPIWNDKYGFGGDGKVGDSTLANGRCVENGPFTNAIPYWQAKADNEMHTYHIFPQPHCLSRGFATGERQELFQASITPEKVEETLEQAEYDEFFAKLELGPHNAVPQFISGDFYYFTAPNGKEINNIVCSFLTQSRSSLLPTSCPDRSALGELATAGSQSTARDQGREKGLPMVQGSGRAVCT